MAAIAGRVMMLPRGPYDESEIYNVIDIVTHNDKAWICRLSNVVGIEPSEENSETWQLLIDAAVADAATLQGNAPSYFATAESVTNLTEKVETNEDNISQNTSDVNTINAEIDSLTERLSIAETDVTENTSKIETAETDIQDLIERVSTTETNISSATESIENLTAQDVGAAPKYSPIRTHTGYTLNFVPSVDIGKMILINSTQDATYIIGPSDDEEPVEFEICRITENTVTVLANTQVTINGIVNGSFSIASQYGIVALKKIGLNEWVLAGDYE